MEFMAAPVKRIEIRVTHFIRAAPGSRMTSGTPPFPHPSFQPLSVSPPALFPPRGSLFQPGEDRGGEQDSGGLDGVGGFAFFDELVELEGGLEDGGAQEA